MSLPAPPVRDSIRAIDRAFDVLDALRAAGGPAAMSDIAARIGLPQPTVHRILRTLMARGYVHQVTNRRYTLGIGLIDLARGAGSSLGASLRPLLSWAVEATRESASVAILDQDEVRYVAHESSDQTVRVFTQVGNRASLHSTGVGKAILSAMTDDEVRATIGRIVLAAQTPTTITDPDELMAEIARVRERGYAVDRGEHDVGVMCVAVPIPGSLPIAVSISGPEGRMTLEHIQSVCLPVVRALADQVGEASAQLASERALGAAMRHQAE